MTTDTLPEPAPFTRDDYVARMRRVVADAVGAGLSGVIVTPGPDLVWLTGYQPTAITERLTMLVLSTDREPTLVVPALERPDAESAEGAGALTMIDWTDGSDPYPLAGELLSSDGRFGISDSAWAMHLLGLQRTRPATSYQALSRVHADDARGQGRQRTGAAGPRRRGRRRDVRRDRSACASPAGARPRSRPIWPGCFGSSATSRSTSPWSGPARTAPTRTTRPGNGSSSPATRSFSTSAACGTATGPTPPAQSSSASRRAEVQEVHDIVRAAQQAGVRGRPAGRAVPGDRPRRPRRHHRGRLRRAVHPPDRSRDRRDHPRAAVHGGGRGAAARARHVLLDRARHLSGRALRGPDRGHRHRHRGRADDGSTTPTTGSASSSRRPPCRSSQDRPGSRSSSW